MQFRGEKQTWYHDDFSSRLNLFIFTLVTPELLEKLFFYNLTFTSTLKSIKSIYNNIKDSIIWKVNNLY